VAIAVDFEIGSLEKKSGKTHCSEDIIRENKCDSYYKLHVPSSNCIHRSFGSGIECPPFIILRKNLLVLVESLCGIQCDTTESNISLLLTSLLGEVSEKLLVFCDM